MIESKKQTCIACLLLVNLLLSHRVCAQDLDLKKNVLSVSALGTSSFIGIMYERVITDQIVGEAGIGILSLGLGITYYPFEIKENHVNFYTGLKYGSRNLITNILTTGRNKKDPVLYIPAGINCISEQSFSLALDFGPSLNGSTSIFGNLRIGFRF